jgi:hypothetical protein
MAEDLGEEDIVGLVFGFEFVATDGAVGAAQVALVSRAGRGNRRRRTRTWGAAGRWWCLQPRGKESSLTIGVGRGPG